MQKALLTAALTLLSLTLHGCGGKGGADDKKCAYVYDLGLGLPGMGNQVCTSINLEDVNDDCCQVFKAAAPKGLSPPSMPSKTDICAKCKDMGPQALKDYTTKNCGAQNLREQSNAMSSFTTIDSCTPADGDCHFDIPTSWPGNLTMHAVFHKVTQGCCDVVQKNLGAFEPFFKDQSIPDLSNFDKDGFCKNCMDSPNLMMKLYLKAIKAKFPKLCGTTSKTDTLKADNDLATNGNVTATDSNANVTHVTVI